MCNHVQSCVVLSGWRVLFWHFTYKDEITQICTRFYVSARTKLHKTAQICTDADVLGPRTPSKDPRKWHGLKSILVPCTGNLGMGRKASCIYVQKNPCQRTNLHRNAHVKSCAEKSVPRFCTELHKSARNCTDLHSLAQLPQNTSREARPKDKSMARSQIFSDFNPERASPMARSLQGAPDRCSRARDCSSG
jgi:hypothetical protein